MAKVELKKPVIEDIAANVKDADAVILVNYLGINVAGDTALRKELREAGVTYKVYKNTMMNFAFKGTDFEALCPHLHGANAIAISKDDATAPARIIKKHLLTNCIGTLIVITTLQIPSSIFTESFLSFLGLGVAVPMPSLGSLASEAINGINTYPHLLFIPSIVISLIILSFNLLGDGLRDAFDPKLKN